jgi:hypothetical protein
MIMRKAFLALTTLTLFASSAYCQMPASAVSQTNVIRYSPPVPSGDVRNGECWTESIAVSRAGARRCMVGNAISDPCFTIAGNAKELVCGANPALKTRGFVLKLTKPLPKSSMESQKPEPWLFVLADGSICEAMTGTLAPVNGEPARWACAIHIGDQITPSGMVTALEPGKIWTADTFPESAIGKQGVEPRKMSVKTIWE